METWWIFPLAMLTSCLMLAVFSGSQTQSLEESLWKLRSLECREYPTACVLVAQVGSYGTHANILPMWLV